MVRDNTGHMGMGPPIEMSNLKKCLADMLTSKSDRGNFPIETLFLGNLRLYHFEQKLSSTLDNYSIGSRNGTKVALSPFVLRNAYQRKKHC